ncbi:MAG: DNA polymerase I, partial [Gammaproteobacteria bacterium]|nr:DNA polymerase I [Gammaproteobacteria bacterium]
MTANSPFILVDGSSYLFRAYHALPPLTNSRGEPTGAIVGVLNMLKRLLDEYQPEYLAVVFDAPGGSFRNQIYSEYKANRPPMPDDLRDQIQPLHEIIRAMGLPLLIEKGVEADDVIGTLARQAQQHGMDTLISTGDKDMAQLVNQRVTLINTMSDKITDRDGVVEKFGVTPEQIIDYLALVGDTSDNIPGVPKCGPKTAAKWLGQYGDLENLMANADEIKGKVGEYLRDSLEQLPLARELTTIKLDVELGQEVPELKPGQMDVEALQHHYTRLESKRLLDTLGDAVEPEPELENPEPVVGEYQTILDQEAFEAWVQRLEQSELFAFDTETNSLDYMQAELVGLSFAIEAGEAAYVPVAHNYPGAPQQL